MGDILEEASRLARERWEATDQATRKDIDVSPPERVVVAYRAYREELEKKQERRKAYARWRIVPFCAFFVILLLALLDVIPESWGGALVLSLVAVVLIVEVWIG